MPPRRRPTIRDVAAATGLSPAAVSYALRGIQTSTETQERVRQAAEELGYSAHPVARALVSGKTGVVGVLSGSLEDLGEQRFVQALDRALGAHGLSMLVTDARGEPQRERELARQLGDRWVDGLIVSPLDPSADEWAEIGETLPLVTVGDALPGPTVGEVLFDNRAGVSLVLEHLHELGHRRVAVLTPSRPTTPDRPAELVVHQVCEALDLSAMVVNSPHSLDGAAEVAAKVLDGAPRPTAIFCLSDSIACGVYAAAQDAGLRMPEELSVAGYDDHPIARVLTPGLTSVSWDSIDVAAGAARLLAAAVDGRPRPRSASTIRVVPRLVKRRSTQTPS